MWTRILRFAVLVLLVAGATSAHSAPKPVEALPAGAVARLGSWRYLHEDTVTRAVVSRDGTLLVTVSPGRPSGVQVWRLADGKRIQQDNGPAWTDVALLPDGKTLAKANWVSGVHLVDLKTGAAIRKIVTPNSTERIAVSPDGKALAAWTVDRQENAPNPTGGRTTVSLYDIATGKLTKQIEHQHDITVVGDVRNGGKGATPPELEPWGIKFVAFSSDGKSVGAAGWDKLLTFWEPRSGEWVREFGGAKDPAFCFAVAHDCGLVAAAHTDRTLRIYDLKTGKQLHKYPTGEQYVRSLAFAPGGKHIAVGGGVSEGGRWISGDAVWEVSTGKRVCELGTWATAMTFTPDGKTLVVCDGVIHLLDAKTGKERQSRVGHRRPIVAVAFSPDGKTLVSEGEDRTLRWWKTKTGTEYRQTEAYSNSLQGSVAFSPDGKLLAQRTDSRSIRILDTKTGKVLSTLKGHQDMICQVAFSADGKRLVSSTRDKATIVWDVVKATEVSRLVNPYGRGEAVCLSPDGSLVAFAKIHNVAPAKTPSHFSILDSATGRVVSTFLIEKVQAASALAFAPDNKTFFVATYGGKVLVVDARTGKERHRLEAHGFWSRCVAVSPDGKRVASAGGHKNGILVWDIATGRKLHEFAVPGQRTSALTFSPDGKLLASAGSGASVVLWDVGR